MTPNTLRAVSESACIVSPLRRCAASLLPAARRTIWPLSLAFLLCCPGSRGHAQPVYTWTGASNNVWATPANWDSNSIPPPEAIVVINSGAPDATALARVTIS